MKKKLYSFFVCIGTLAVICFFAVALYNANRTEMIKLQSLARIAEVKPLIIAAEGQRAIDLAVANSIYTNSFVTLLAFLLPYLAIAIVALYKLTKLGLVYYAQIRSANHNATGN